MTEPTSIATVETSTEIDASGEDVWRALTDNIGKWWPAMFYTGGEVGKRSFHLEATPGGRMFEQWQSGGGTLWAHVVSLSPGSSIQLVGHIFPNWGGPVQWFGTCALTEQNGGTVLTFSETAVGKTSDQGMQEKEKGWNYLWSCMKAYIEGAAEPPWTD